MRKKLTSRFVETVAPPTRRRAEYHDELLPGLRFRVFSTGRFSAAHHCSILTKNLNIRWSRNTNEANMKSPVQTTLPADLDCSSDRSRTIAPTALNAHELLVRADLRSLGIRASNPTLLAWEADGKFPKRLAISAAKVAWLRHEVIAWIDAKVAARG
jgi:predicted DNA-binding transcriptional regulator AlpA